MPDGLEVRYPKLSGLMGSGLVRVENSIETIYHGVGQESERDCKHTLILKPALSRGLPSLGNPSLTYNFSLGAASF